MKAIWETLHASLNKGGMRRNLRLIKSRRADVARFLRSLRRASPLYFPNPGNAGDALIHVATVEALGRAGIRVEYAKPGDYVAGRTVLVGGGGNLVPFYDNVERAIEAFSAGGARIVVLPHTVRGHEITVRKLGTADTVFCRDRGSFDHIRSVNPAPNVLLGHDMAFHLDAAGFLRNRRIAARAAPMLQTHLGEHGMCLEDVSRRSTVTLTRMDVERHADAPTSDLDISLVFMFEQAPAQMEIAAWCFLKFISATQHIVTDRLHIAIGAALLNKRCDVLDNCYGKVSQVFDHSLRDFPNLRFMPFESRKAQ